MNTTSRRGLSLKEVSHQRFVQSMNHLLNNLYETDGSISKVKHEYFCGSRDGEIPRTLDTYLFRKLVNKGTARKDSLFDINRVKGSSVKGTVSKHGGHDGANHEKLLSARWRIASLVHGQFMIIHQHD